MDFRDVTRAALWSVSTVKGGYEIFSMFDGKTDTFWQSDAAPPHWFSAEFPRQTFLSKISIYLAIQPDDTYTPIELEISVATDPAVRTCIKTEEPKQLQGWVDIELNVSTIFLRVTLNKNYRGGKDSRIRQVKLYGAPYSPCVDSSVCFLSPEITQYLSIR